SIGGVVGCVAGITAYGFFIMRYTGSIAVYHLIIIGLLCGFVSQIGDWAASAIKRSVGIKDYGRLMPGHGGVLDRCDSMLFTAPVVYFYITMFVK
ncbi:MAG: phosphatidate cytidylyltransferase, partial [Clostridiales bacterium]|nr:phosphatidate cytidylyltransferase [Clostridiales bacterium]